MRRMLDPKEVGGSGKTIHGYRIYPSTGNVNCYYIVYSEADNNWEIGEKKNVQYFPVRHKELLKPGYYPAGGYFESGTGDKIIVSQMYVSVSKSVFPIVYDLTTNTYKESSKDLYDDLFNAVVVKLF